MNFTPLGEHSCSWSAAESPITAGSPILLGHLPQRAGMTQVVEEPTMSDSATELSLLRVAFCAKPGAFLAPSPRL